MSRGAKKTVVLLVLLVSGVLSLYFWGRSAAETTSVTPNSPTTFSQSTTFDSNETTSSSPIENKTDILAANCAKDLPIAIIDDISFDPDKKLVILRWSEGNPPENITLLLPYSPETNFAGCSESATKLLKHVQSLH